MRQFIIFSICFLAWFKLLAQTEFHVFPNGTPTGTGSMEDPWDLQTALSQKPEIVNGGDTVWIHAGTYNGRFVSLLKSTIRNKNIVVSSFGTDNVILNGNLNSNRTAVLEVKGNNVSFIGLEITFLGDFSRKMVDATFQNVYGVNHLSGEDCEFINLKIHNNPGTGFGSWKSTGGSSIIGCQIFENGYFSKVRGSGAGIYVQNSSDKTRLIKNNLIFNNYYMGIEAWSATTRATSAYVKNISIKNNIIFNNGMPGGLHKNNLLVGTDDRNGINRASNIIVEDNIFYHNTDIANNKSSGDAGSLQLGVNDLAPLKNVSVNNNVIIGGNNALRLNVAEDITFQNNIVYGGYVHLYKEVLNNLNTWKYDNNSYYSKNNRNFRIMDYKDYTFEEWRQAFTIDKNSNWKNIKEFSLPPVLNITQDVLRKFKFQVALFEREGNDVTVDFSDFAISENSNFAIKNVATKEIIQTGTLSKSKDVIFPMGIENGTFDNFGVFIIEFDTDKTPSTENESSLKKILKWMGL